MSVQCNNGVFDDFLGIEGFMPPRFNSSNKVMMVLSIFQTTPVIIFPWWRSAVPPMCHSQPIRGQYPSHVITLDQSKASFLVKWSHWTNPRPVQCPQCAIYSSCFPREGVSRALEAKNCLHLAALGPTSLSNGQPSHSSFGLNCVLQSEINVLEE